MAQAKQRDKRNILVFLLLLITVAAVCVAVWALFFRIPAEPILPDRAPSVEEHAQPIPGDGEDSIDAKPGSGSVSLTYSNRVDISLADKTASLLFTNPGRSNQDMVLQLVIQDRVIFQSGRIKPGNQVTQLDISTEAAAMLVPGGYDAVFLLHFYDPVTGDKAMVTTEIPVLATVIQ